MVRRRKPYKEGDDLVLCDGCMRRLHLDYTNFDSFAEAEEGRLVCRIYRRVGGDLS